MRKLWETVTWLVTFFLMDEELFFKSSFPSILHIWEIHEILTYIKEIYEILISLFFTDGKIATRGSRPWNNSRVMSRGCTRHRVREVSSIADGRDARGANVALTRGKTLSSITSIHSVAMRFLLDEVETLQVITIKSYCWHVCAVIDYKYVQIATQNNILSQFKINSFF